MCHLDPSVPADGTVFVFGGLCLPSAQWQLFPNVCALAVWMTCWEPLLESHTSAGWKRPSGASSPTFSNKQDQFWSFIRLFKVFLYKSIISKLMIPFRNTAIIRLGTSAIRGKLFLNSQLAKDVLVNADGCGLRPQGRANLSSSQCVFSSLRARVNSWQNREKPELAAVFAHGKWRHQSGGCFLCICPEMCGDQVLGVGGLIWKDLLFFKLQIYNCVLCDFLCDRYLHFNHLESLEPETFSDLPKLERLWVKMGPFLWGEGWKKPYFVWLFWCDLQNGGKCKKKLPWRGRF